MYKILIVDDEPQIVEILSVFFAKKGFDVVPALGGAKAIEVLRSGDNIDVMILDMKMPSVKGVDVLKEMKNLNKNWPIIVLSGSIDINKRKADIKALGFGRAEYLIKPIDLNTLLGMVKKMLNQ